MKNLIFLFFLTAVLSLSATTLTVSLDGTQDYTVIQSAINASDDGDTVLVHPGTYYENVIYNGHNITLASLELTTGDPQYIHTTIIDGNHQNSCVRICNDEEEVTLRGFTLIHGSGCPYYDGTITGGGGIYASFVGDVYLVNCQIKYNYATGGGGIFFYITEGAHFSGISVHDNFSYEANGGIAFADETNVIEFDANNLCSVYNNFGAGDIYCMNINECNVVVDTFTVAQPKHYFANYGWWRSAYENHNPYTFDIQHGYIEQVNQDLYVSPDGDDNNDGLSEGSPLKNIAVALNRIESDSLNPKTVHLAEGTYNLWDGERYFLVAPKQYVNIIGAGMEKSIIDANGYCCALTMLREHGDNILQDFCVQGVYALSNSTALYCSRSKNVQFLNLLIKDNTTDSHAGHYFVHGENVLYKNVHFLNNTSTMCYGGMEYEGRDVTFDGCVFDGNYAGSDDFFPTAALFCDYIEGDLILRNSIFRNNSGYSTNGSYSYIAVLDLHPLHEDESRIIVENNLFYDNAMEPGTILLVQNHTGEAHISGNTFVNNACTRKIILQNGNAEMYNNVFWDNSGYYYNVYVEDWAGTNYNVIMDYNDIEYGQQYIYHDAGDEFLDWGEHNVDVDPMFVSQFGYDYMLSADSPLIDQGQPEPWEELHPYDLLGNERIWDGDGDGIARMDIGCYEYQYMAPPEELAATQSGQDVLLTWDHPVRSLNGWNIYRDSSFVALSPAENGTQYTDFGAPTGDHYYYVTAQYGNIESTPTNTVSINVLSTEDNVTSPTFFLSNHPNPFNPSTTISYSIPSKTDVKLAIYNIRGQKVTTLVHETQEAGPHLITWQGIDHHGKPVSSGIYFYRLETQDNQLVKKMMLLK